MIGARRHFGCANAGSESSAPSRVGNRTLMIGAAGSPTIYPVPTPSELCSGWDWRPPMRSASGTGAKTGKGTASLPACRQRRPIDDAAARLAGRRIRSPGLLSKECEPAWPANHYRKCRRGGRQYRRRASCARGAGWTELADRGLCDSGDLSSRPTQEKSFALLTVSRKGRLGGLASLLI